MSEAVLLGYGMRRIGKAYIDREQFVISCDDERALSETHCIYGFLAGDEIIRVGSSSGRLSGRLREWQRDVSRALSGNFARTREAEALAWREIMAEHGLAHLFSRKGTFVETPVGGLNLYLAEESVLIGRHKPRLCHDRRRHRDQPSSLSSAVGVSNLAELTILE